MCEPDKRNLMAIWKHWSINNEQARKLLFLSLFRSQPRRHAYIFFKIMKVLCKTTCHQIIKYVHCILYNLYPPKIFGNTIFDWWGCNKANAPINWTIILQITVAKIIKNSKKSNHFNSVIYLSKYTLKK